jgi:hypothetical protein
LGRGWFILKIAGGVIWVALWALEQTNVITSKKINATPHDTGQVRHAVR